MDTASSPTISALPVIRRAALWLCLLAPFFYLTYGIANWLASQRAHVPNLAFDWEGAIPFYAWTIVPYWSINAFYALSLFINDTSTAVDRLAKRYLMAQVVAVTCFIAFPLTAIFTRPETSGLPGFMFAVLGGFDKPFNQAPSLHIALLVIIWDHLRRKLPGGVRQVWHVWCFLIGVSVLTTYQHHFIDIPTGALLGLFALWFFPHGAPSPLAGFHFTTNEKARRLGRAYAVGACLLLLLTVSGVFLTGYALLFLWPALALAIVSVGYFGAGPPVFQKAADGKVTLASHWLLMPYRFGARLNIRYWTRALPARIEITDGVFLGRFPTGPELSGIATVIDLTGELIALRSTTGTVWKSFPALDLVAPPDETLAAAAGAIEASRPNGPVLVCCALGFQRSAATVMHWLVATSRSPNRYAALELLKSKGRPVHLPAMVTNPKGSA
ncbi:phosphatase PAP2 family protein [Pararhizobium sp.]|uniref:phosphatase PAP2 family protein n=1 Tax=Pararhizobium sp. TaxID=1977563 RepID=UPI0039C9866C